MKYLLLLLGFVYINIGFGQEDFYHEDYIYQENIKSVKFYATNNPLSYPVSNLSGIPLYFEFDDIDGDNKNYYYKILHCDMDWNISKEIEENDFLDGFNGEEIKNSESSSFTLLQYSHYKLRLPNENTKWLLSGNYLLVVYDENEDVAITRRFLVAENNIKIFAQINHAKDVSQYRTTQSLEIVLNNKDFRIVDPLKEIRVTVLQNDKWFDAIKKVSPKYLLGDEIKFDAFDPFLFEALNEFRYFDTRSLHSTNLEVHSIDIRRRGVEVVLEEDEIRRYSNYFFHTDINGNYLYLNQDNPNAEITSQYTNVKFTLNTHAPLLDHDVYVIGGFSDWQLYDENKLEYDKGLEAYTGKILLKQGVIDYYYASVDKDQNINLAALEGSWFQTQNDYMILVYLRPFGGTYDRLIGMRIIE